MANLTSTLSASRELSAAPQISPAVASSSAVADSEVSTSTAPCVRDVTARIAGYHEAVTKLSARYARIAAEEFGPDTGLLFIAAFPCSASGGGALVSAGGASGGGALLPHPMSPIGMQTVKPTIIMVCRNVDGAKLSKVI